MIPIARPQMGDEEKEAVWSVLSSGALAQGARVREMKVGDSRNVRPIEEILA